MEKGLQKTFCENYVKTLRDRIVAGISIGDYLKDEFPYDKSMVKPLAGVYQSVRLIGKMNPDNDLEFAKVIYDAYAFFAVADCKSATAKCRQTTEDAYKFH